MWPVLFKLLKNPTWSVQLLWNAMKIKFSDFNITRDFINSYKRYITRKRTKVRHFPETRYGKKLI